MTKSVDEEKPESPLLPVDKTQVEDVEEKATERKANCATWSNNLLKNAKIGKITQEFRNAKDFNPNLSCSISDKMGQKNRYNQILCADENRVILKEREGANDYIHASWMEMPDAVRFISTQGPMKSTCGDFWHMIFTEKCSVIVMLCQYVESDEDKCYRYFPAEGDEATFGEYKVKVVEKTSEFLASVKYTLIQVQKKGVKHTVHHYWYHDWPDQIAPFDPTPMVKLYQMALKKSNNSPIVVHCSAGVGRTATFVGIHLGSAMIRENAQLEMVDVLKKLRTMRIGAVQSQLQYVFLHLCIVQLFIEENVIKKDALFETFLKKHAGLTRKVAEEIGKEETLRKKKKHRRASDSKEEKRDDRKEEKRDEKKKEEKKGEKKEEKKEERKKDPEEKTSVEKPSERKDSPSVFASGRDRSKYERSKFDKKPASRFDKKKTRYSRPSKKKSPSGN